VAGGTGAVACGMGRAKPTGAVIDNFDGMKQTVEWRLSDATQMHDKVVMPNGSLNVVVTGTDTLAVGALAFWAAMNRSCMDGSSYMGIQFTVKGNVTTLLLQVATPATYPLADGGTCNSATLCAYAHYQKDITASLPTGGTVKVAFADLKAAFGTPAAFDKSALVALVFLTHDATATHSFNIDNISFY
jgi:hypothetical protein